MLWFDFCNNLNFDLSCFLWFWFCCFWVVIRGDFINFYNIYKIKYIWDIYSVDG